MNVKNGRGTVSLRVKPDARVVRGCIYLPAGFSETAGVGLGGSFSVEAGGEA